MDARLRIALDDATGIAFLCSGNMIRSAFAELYARHLGCVLPVRSGATLYRNDGIHGPTGRALEARGVDPSLMRSFRSTHLTELLPQLDNRAVYLGMKREHLAALPPTTQTGGRAFLLTQVLGREQEIADPMFEGGLERVLALVAECVEALVAGVSA
jgi:protein-tyrosine-phosphatase